MKKDTKHSKVNISRRLKKKIKNDIIQGHLGFDNLKSKEIRIISFRKEKGESILKYAYKIKYQP